MDPFYLANVDISCCTACFDAEHLWHCKLPRGLKFPFEFLLAHLVKACSRGRTYPPQTQSSDFCGTYISE